MRRTASILSFSLALAVAAWAQGPALTAALPAAPAPSASTLSWNSTPAETAAADFSGVSLLPNFFPGNAVAADSQGQQEQGTQVSNPSPSSNSGDSLQHSEVSVQVSGVFQAHRANTSVHDFATHSAGLLLGYRLHLSHWEAIEVEYGYTRNGQRYFTPATAPGTPGAAYAVQAAMHEGVANEVITTPRILGFFQPFVLAGGGVLYFQPRGFSAIAVSSQWRPTFNYGFGADFHIDHIGARVEFQGLIFKAPDFKNALLTSNVYTHVAQPSAGLVFTF